MDSWKHFLSLKHVVEALLDKESPVTLSSVIRIVTEERPFHTLEEASIKLEWSMHHIQEYDALYFTPIAYEVADTSTASGESIGDFLSTLSGHENTGKIEDFLDFIGMQLNDESQPASEYVQITHALKRARLENMGFDRYQTNPLRYAHHFNTFGYGQYDDQYASTILQNPVFQQFWTVRYSPGTTFPPIIRLKREVELERAQEVREQEERYRRRTTVIPATQFLRAWTLAKHFRHCWADSVTALVTQGKVEGWTPQTIDEAVRPEDYYEDFGAKILQLDEKLWVTHRTDTRRFAWSITPDGAIVASISRPEHPQAITIVIDGHMSNVRVTWESDIALYDRHYSAVRWFLSAFFPVVRIERLYLQELSQVITQEETED